MERKSKSEDSIEAGMAALGGEGGGEIDEVLLEHEPDLQHRPSHEHFPKQLVKGRERDGEQVHQEHRRVTDCRIQWLVADPAGDLKEGDGRKGRRTARRGGGFATTAVALAILVKVVPGGLPLRVEADNEGAVEGPAEEGERRGVGGRHHVDLEGPGPGPGLARFHGGGLGISGRFRYPFRSA